MLSANSPNYRSVTVGCVYMLVASFFLALMHGCVRYISADIHPFEVTFFRMFFGLVCFMPWFLINGFGVLRTKRLALHGTRAVANAVAMLTFFMALSLTPLVKVQALAFTAPLFATALAALLLGEIVRLRRWTAMAIGFVGALVIIRPGVVELDIGSIYTLVSALVWGFTLVIIKRLAQTETATTITAYMVLLMTPICLIPAAMYWIWPVGMQWLWLAVCGVFGTIAQFSMAKAFTLADATVVLPFDFSKVIWGAAIGWVAFHEFVDLWTWIGALVIFAGAFYIAYRERQLENARNRPGESSV